MPRRKRPSDAEQLREQLISLLVNFENYLKHKDLRSQVKKLIEASELLGNLGVSLPEVRQGSSARDRILLYMQKHVGTVLDGRELMVVSGISEYARRIRELRVEFGWPILTGVTIQELDRGDIEHSHLRNLDITAMRPDEYLLASLDQDRDAAYRWRVANQIRQQRGVSTRDKILNYLKENVGKNISGEELRYVANNATEWGRRTRELRTEFGWSISTQSTGRPDLPVGIYVLESTRQLPTHDRRISDEIRRITLRRDGYKCQRCGWSHEEWNSSDARHLEAHHQVAHASGGANTAENLITLCNVCHDVVHKEMKQATESK